MSSPVNSEALIAAFAFGIVANAASAATYFSVKGHGLSIFRDGVRLALVTFLFASSLWALADFIVLSSEFDKGCQITLSIGSAFDQIARVAFAQFLLVGAQGGFKLTLGTFLPQATVFLRFVLGVVYASFRRPQFQPICVRQTGILPIGIAVLSLDATLILFFVFKVNQKRSYLELVEEVKRTKTLFLSIGGFAVWTALSAPMILGIKSFNLTLRTVPPAVGLLVLIIIVLFCMHHLLAATERGPMSPIFGKDKSRLRPFRLNKDINEPPMVSTFNPDGPTSRLEDVKGKVSTTISALKPQKSKWNKVLPSIRQPNPGRNSVGMGGLPVTGRLFPPLRFSTATALSDSAHSEILTPRGKHFKFKPAKPKPSKLSLPPILRKMSDKRKQEKQDKNMPTINVMDADKEERARASEERKSMHPGPLESHSVAQKQASPPPPVTLQEMLSDSESVMEMEPETPIHVQQVSVPHVSQLSLAPMLLESAMRFSFSRLSPIEEKNSPRPSSRGSIRSLLSRATPKIPGSSLKTESPRPLTDAWDLLSVQDRASVSDFPPPPPPRSPLRNSTGASPATKSVSAMSTSSRPMTGTMHSRSTSVASGKSGLSLDAPLPPIPEKSLDRQSKESFGAFSFQASDSERLTDSSYTNKVLPIRTESLTSHVASVVTVPPKAAKLNSVFAPKSNFKPILKRSESEPVNTLSEPMTSLSRQSSIKSESSQDTVESKAVKELDEIQEQASKLLKELEEAYATSVVDIMDALNEKKPTARQSVLNRPRPITRAFDHYTGEVHTLRMRQKRHRRSMSVGSLQTRPSILNAIPGSPSNLPPLPPTPKSSGLRPLLNNTKSMTFDEKMVMFLSAKSPSTASNSASVASSRALRRRSSMPEFSSEQMEELKNLVGDSKGDRQPGEADRSTKSSVRTQSIFDDEEKPFDSKHTSHESMNRPTSMERPVSCLPESRASSRASSIKSHQSRVESLKKQNLSPGVPTIDLLTPSSMGASTPGADEDSSRAWDSVHYSPAKVVGFAKAQARAVEVSSPRTSRSFKRMSVDRRESMQSLGARDSFQSFQSRQTVSMLLEQLETEALALESPGLPPTEEVEEPVESTWHRRVGDKCPAFSVDSKPRKAFAPTPLLLNTRQPTTRLLVAAEPSPVDSVESPESALEKGEAQIKVLDYSHKPTTEQQRLAMLEDLEMEVGMQETEWQMLHANVRDSIQSVASSAYSPPNRDQLGLPNIPKMDRFSMRSILGDKSRQQSKSPYMDNESLQNFAGSRLSYLNVSVPTTQLGSPTPPESEDEYDVTMMLSAAIQEYHRVERPAPTLWKASSPVNTKPAAQLWIPELPTSPVEVNIVEFPEPVRQPLPKRDLEPLTIETTQLWTPPTKTVTRMSGLWRSTSVKPRPKSIARKPTRRNKRITLLPDIVESPKPLPNSTEALGLYQFPWGEMSDTATISHPFAAMPGTMTSGNRYSGASFFDDTDEDDQGDNFSDYEDSEEDDFDESTLWEIASLLLPTGWTGDDAACGEQSSPASSMETPRTSFDSIPMMLDSANTTPKAAQLWEHKSEDNRAPKSLPQSDSWNQYTEEPSPIKAPRRNSAEIARRNSIEIAPLASTDMWSKPASTSAAPQAMLWGQKAPVQETYEDYEEEDERPSLDINIPRLSSGPVFDIDWLSESSI